MFCDNNVIMYIVFFCLQLVAMVSAQKTIAHATELYFCKMFVKCTI